MHSTVAFAFESVREAINGGSPISPEVARKMVTLFRTFRPRPGTDYDLTGPETRLRRMLVDGHNYTTAAEELKVSVNTVAFHMKRIYEKLQVHSKSEAVAKALREGVIQELPGFTASSRGSLAHAAGLGQGSGFRRYQVTGRR